jgi:LacI family transcriptional regulator
LAGSALVKPATRARVEAAAKELGYVRDLYFSAMSTQRHKKSSKRMLVHYLHGSPDPNWEQAGFSISSDMFAHAADYGMDVEMVNWGNFERIEQVPERLYAQGSSGLLLGVLDHRVHAPLRDFGRLPVVCCQRQEGLPFHTVRFGVASAMRLCWQKVREAGYRRIGLAVMRHKLPHLDDGDRLGAALALIHGVSSAEGRIPPLTAVLNDSKAFRNWIQEYQPDAVIGFNNGLWWDCLDARGKHIPFFSLHAYQDQDTAHISGVFEDSQRLVSEALRQMDGMIRHGEIGVPESATHIVIDQKWMDGETVEDRPRL